MKLFGTPGHSSRKKDKEQEENYEPQFALPGSSELVSLKEEPWSHIFLRWTQSLFLYILLLLLVVAALYSGLAATLLVVSPTGDPSGRAELVVRNMWQDNGGKPPIGEEAVISTTTPLPGDITGKVLLGWTGIPSPAVTEVASNHMDRLTVKGSEVLIGDTWQPLVSTDIYQVVENSTAETNVQLDDQFLVKCVEGACEAGTYMVIDRDHIYGERREL